MLPISRNRNSSKGQTYVNPRSPKVNRHLVENRKTLLSVNWNPYCITVSKEKSTEWLKKKNI